MAFDKFAILGKLVVLDTSDKFDVTTNLMPFQRLVIAIRQVSSGE